MSSQGRSRLTGLRVENAVVAGRMDEMRPRFERIGNRHEDDTAPRAVSAYQLFQTPPDLAERLVGGLDAGARSILEPSAGLGRLYTACRARFPEAWISLVEIDPALAGELYIKTEADSLASLRQRDFLETEPTPAFDAVAMNPPFHLRGDIAHIKHALKFLRPGGVLRALCLDTRHREEELKPLACQWEKIPEGAFSQEGTRVATVLLTIRKQPDQETQHHD